MRTKLVFEIDDFDGDCAFGAPDPDNEDDYLTASSDGKNDAAVAKSLKLTPEAVKQIREGFVYFAEMLCESLRKDLEDLYDAIPEK